MLVKLLSIAVICLSCNVPLRLAENSQDDNAPLWTTFVSRQNFRTVFKDDLNNRLYVGAVNKIYEFNPENITLAPKEINWSPEEHIQQTCLNFKDDKMLCQNNIGVLVLVNRTHLYACGTMAYSPTCVYILKEGFRLLPSTIEQGRWKSPYDPYVSTVSVVANQTLFTATRGSMQGNDGIISRALNGVTLRTQEGDKYWLNDPLFLGGYHVKNRNTIQDKVMLFFREKSEEFQPYLYGMASDPRQRNVVSRVATVCVNDHGGTAWVLNRKFATYSKMTIVCNTESGTDDTSFRYNNLESTFVLENEDDPTNPTIYGVFTMPDEAVAGSAVCAYTMNDVRAAMATNLHWNRMQDERGTTSTYDLNYPAPGTCVQETQLLTQPRLTFGKRHPIKFGNIYPSQSRPKYQESGVRYKHIAVAKVGSRNDSGSQDNAVTVMYMITADALLKRVVFDPTISPNPRPLPDIQVAELGDNECVLNMMLGERYLYVATNSTLVQVPLAACSLYKNCRECSESNDPYCALDDAGSCVSVFEMSSNARKRRSVSSGSCALQDVVQIAPEEVIQELRANLSRVTTERDESMGNLTVLLRDREANIAALETCENRTAALRLRAERLEEGLRSANLSLEECRGSLTAERGELARCHSRTRWALEKAAEFQRELATRPTRAELNKEITNKHVVSALLRRCRVDLANATSEARNCSAELVSAETTLLQTNETCTREKEIMQEQINAFYRKVDHLRALADALTYEANFSLTTAERKLGRCYNQLSNLSSINTLLKRVNRNQSSGMANCISQNQRDIRIIRQLRWLHKKNGYRGQQNCEHNGWFLSNATGHLFRLGRERGIYDGSKQLCRRLDAQLASFHNVDELRYVNNVIRAFEPTRHYWLGLIKHGNGSLIWEDGTIMDDMDGRFPESQRERLRNRNTYCVQMGSSGKWYLIPCSRNRRPICLKVTTPGTRNVLKLYSNYRKDVK